MKGEGDFFGIVVPIERIFHFVTIKIRAVVGFDFGSFDIYAVFAEKFDDEVLF